MPRRKTAVKIKSIGAVDIHFHGAFGIDVMTARPEQLDDLARRLAQQGVAAFCPTTLSVPFKDLRAAVQRLGAWTALRQKRPDPRLARPLGIHLEGPYLHPGACGAHPARAIRKFSFRELELLWEDSSHQLKIITLAPDRMSARELRTLALWASDRGIRLSLGHSQASEEQARHAFEQGFSSLTHGWNALGFHQRSPGAMGAALGRPGVFIELILDQVHVSPTVMRWTRQLHGPQLCYVSDCVPAAEARGKGWHSFGDLKIRHEKGACRLKNGQLAGGAVLLPKAFANWIAAESRHRKLDAARLLRVELPSLWEMPLRSLGLSARQLKLASVEWEINPQGRIRSSAISY